MDPRQGKGTSTLQVVTVLLVYFFVFYFSVPVVAQAPLRQPVTLHAEGVRLDTLFERLSRLTGIPFAYSPDRIDAARRLDVTALEEPLGHLLDRLGEEAAFRYRYTGSHLLILPAKGAHSLTTRFLLAGYVVDSVTGERLPYASVRLRSGTGQAANAYGFFSFSLPGPDDTLTVSHVGYAVRDLPLRLDGDTLITVSLAPAAPLKEVKVVLPQELSPLLSRDGMLSLAPSVLQEMPSFLGESDVMKSLEMMPGITFFGDGSTFFFVRGGNRDQNLVLIDDAPVYNPSHMFGVFSSVTPEAVKSLRIYKGYFPAGLGGRLSSVVDIRTRTGDRSHVGAEGSFSPATVRVAVQGPAVAGRSTFFLAGRRSWFGWFPRKQNPSVERLRFYDLNGRFTFTLDERNRFSFSFYKGNDLYRQRSEDGTNTSGITWGNLAGSLRWNHLIGKKLFLNTTVYGGSYDYDLVSSFENDFTWHSHVADFGLRSDLSWFRRRGDRIRGGLVVSGHNFNPGNIYYRGRIAGGPYPVVPVKNTVGLAAYVSRRQHFLPRLTVEYGLRLSSWSNAGGTWEFRYDEAHRPVDSVYHAAGTLYHTCWSLSPRLSVSYAAAAGRFSLAYGHTAQYMHLLTNQVTPFSSFEIWVPAGPSLRPQRADHLQGGWTRSFGQDKFLIDVEAYLRKIRGQIDYVDHASLLLTPTLERDLRQGTAQAWGSEVLLRKEGERLSGWLSYAYSRIFLKTAGINEGIRYPASWDRPHRMTLALMWHFSGHWTAGSNLLAASGAPFSSPTAFFTYRGVTVPWYGSRNNDRFPPYFRLDFSLTWRYARPGKRFRQEVIFALFNATGRKNPFEINFNKSVAPDGSLVVPADLYTPPVLVPTRMYLYRMIPSVTYRFKI